jgi:hypothetical protein
MRLGNRELRVALIVATGFIGCADGTSSGPPERVSEVSQEWGTAACAAATADTTQWVRIPSVLSPQTYNTCKKSYVVDLFEYGGAPPDAGATGGSSGSGGPSLSVMWSGALPSTQAECEASFLGGIFYRGEFVASPDGGSGTWVWGETTGQRKQDGVWSNGSCQIPPVVYSPLAVGESYRVAATARNSLNETRRVSIFTVP